MTTELILTALRNDYLNIFEREDPLVEGLGHLVMSLPRHILASDSMTYVRFLSMRLSIMIPGSHEELKAVPAIWSDFIHREGTRIALKGAVRLLARLKRTYQEPELQRLLRALSSYLHITDGEHWYMEASLLYLTSVVRKAWSEEGDAAVTEERLREIVKEVTDGLEESRTEVSRMRKGSFAPVLVTGDYNTELLYRIKLREQDMALRRKAEADRLKDERRARREAASVMDEGAILRKRALLSIQNGRARATLLRPVPMKEVLDRMGSDWSMEQLADLRLRFAEELRRTDPGSEQDIRNLFRCYEDWISDRTTMANMKRRSAAFMRPVLRRQDVKTMYIGQAMCLLFTKDPQDIRFAVDTYLVPWLGDPKELTEKINGVLKALGLEERLLLPTALQYNTIEL